MENLQKSNGLEKVSAAVTPQPENREPIMLVEGKMSYSFGKNGWGLTDELIKIGEIVKRLSRDNHVYIEEAFIDSCDDVYDFTFRITPHEGFGRELIPQNS